MFKKILSINIFLIFLSSFTYAEIIKDIVIKGNKRLSKESILVFGNIDINEDYNDKKLNTLLKDLYSTDFFKNVKLSIINNTLTISVIENPIIEDLEINGIESKQLTEKLYDLIQLKSRKSYIDLIFLKDLNLIKNVIKTNGYYFAEIKTSLIKNEERNSVKLIYDIDLGDRAKISEISFIGDKKIKDRKLMNVITSEESRFWKFISNRSYVDKKRIDLDRRLLIGYFKDNGYYNVKVENSFVEFKNNGSFKLIFNIEAGNKFIFNKLNLLLPDDFDPKYFNSINKLLRKYENKPYSLSKINKILDEIDKVALSKKYEFIDANLTENIIDENKLDIQIALVETEKFYIEKINILGNSFTLEEVIRNSFVVDEGDPYNEILFNKTINALKSKNIFATVDSKIYDGSAPGLKVVDVTVEEKPTGEISLAAGLGTGGGTLGGGVKENNFLGKDIKLDTNLTFSENSVKGQFVYSKPNFNNTDNTLFTSVKSITTDNLTDYGYETSNVSFSIGTGFEQYENLYFRPEIEVGSEKLKTNSLATSNLKKQEGTYFDTYFNYSLRHDLRNSSYRPTDGHRTFFYQELPLVSERNEIVNAIEFVKYQKLVKDMVGRMSIYGKAINTISDEDVRVSKRLYIPSNKLRGFESGKIGPIDNNDFVGGNYISAFNLSTTIPQALPSFENTDISVFFDAANVWGVDYNSSMDDKSTIRSSIGIAVDLLIPGIPLNFSLSQPLTKSSSDITETFRFNIGTSF
jgi:outer membrane protein insertion porin family